MSGLELPEITFRIDGKGWVRRRWMCVPRVGERVFLPDQNRGPDQYAAEVVAVSYHDVEEIRRYHGVRVEIDVEWITP